MEVAQARILERVMGMYQKEPMRMYFYFDFVSATVPCSEVQVALCSPSRVGGRSIPYGCHLPVSRHVSDGVFVVPLGEVGEWTEDSLLQDLFDDFCREDAPFVFPEELEGFDDTAESFGDEDDFVDEA
jgi:hypothetical protein